jgi:hypothetical protein
MNVNTKMMPVETISGIGGRRIKQNVEEENIFTGL